MGHVPIIDGTHKPKRPDVLTMTRIRNDLFGLGFKRHKPNVTSASAKIRHGRFKIGTNRCVLDIRPFVVEKNNGALAHGPHIKPRIQNLFVKGHHEIGLVAGIGDGTTANPDAVS